MSAEENPQTVTGVVTDPNGNPLEGVVCVLKRQSDNVTFETTTNSDGEYRFEGLSEGTYHGVVRYEDSRGNKYTSTNKPNIDVIGYLPPAEVQDQRIITSYYSVRSLDPADLSVTWEYDSGGSLQVGGVATQNGDVYALGITSALIYSTDSSDGSENWTFSIGSNGDGAPRVIDGVVYAGDSTGSLYAVNSDGTENWTATLTNNVRTATFGDGSLYVTDTDVLYSLDPSDGSENWSVSPVDFRVAPAYYEGTLYTAEVDNLRSRDPSDGSVNWTYSNGGLNYNSAPGISGGSIYFGDENNDVVSVDISDGSENWKFSTGNSVRSNITAHNGVVYAGSNDGNLYAINDDGTEKWSFSAAAGGSLGEYVQTTPSVIDTSVFIGAQNGELYEINISDGTQVNSFTEPTGNSVVGTPIGGSDGWSVSNMQGRAGNKEPISPWW